MLTDSGGFQVFSLAELRKITEEGVDASSQPPRRLARTCSRPSARIEIQEALGADIIMALRRVPALPPPRARRTSRQSLRAHHALGCSRCARPWSRRAAQRSSASSRAALDADLRRRQRRGAVARSTSPATRIGGLLGGRGARGDARRRARLPRRCCPPTSRAT